MFGLSGCTEKKYNVDYCGSKSDYENAKDAYRAGEKVKLYYSMIATDTDYSFYLDGEPLNYDYDDKKGFIITFTMPEHDVKLECRSVNSMLYQPDDPLPESEEMLVDYYTAIVGTVGGDRHTEYVLYAYSEEQVKLVVYSQEYGEEEQSTAYLVPAEAADRCLEACKKNKLSKWEKMKNGTAITGGSTVVRYKDGDSYVRASTENMPEDGKRKLDEIGIIIREYIDEEYRLTE